MDTPKLVDVVESGLAKSQQVALKRIRDRVVIWDGNEIKEQRVFKHDGCSNLYFTVTVGGKNDEGTALFLCRDYYMFVIGKRGGILQLDGKINLYPVPKYMKKLNKRMGK